MKSIFKRLIRFHILTGLLFLVVNFFIFHAPNIRIAINFGILSTAFSIQYYYSRRVIEQIEKETVQRIDKREAEYQQAIKNIYDEHIFSITHELRSPLSVIAGSSLNELNNLRSIFNNLKIGPDGNIDNAVIKQNIINIKKCIATTQDQVEIIESFISTISEYGSYVSEKGHGKRFLNLQEYLINVLNNSHSFSRNMRVFKNNIMFGDGFGRDFDSSGVEVNPHDLSRILMNLMTNAADAVASCYKHKKSLDENYEPTLKIRCIKSENKNKSVEINDSYMKVIDSGPCPIFLVVEDNGPGITKENLTKIFQYGFSTKKDPTKIHYGLGLHLTLKLAQKNNLSIFVKTDEYGTKFAIGFPSIFLENTGDEDANCSKDCNKLSNESVKNETDTQKDARFSDSEEN